MHEGGTGEESKKLLNSSLYLFASQWKQKNADVSKRL